MYKIQPKTVFIGKTTEYLPVCHSTNDYCQQLINENLPQNGHLVYTGFQTAGRGQRGNTWEGKAGENIMMSLILKPFFLKASEQFQLNMVVSLGIFEALNKLIKEKIGLANLKIKWPNDIYFNDKKLGGILIENSIAGLMMNFSIIGIGLNINQLKFDNAKAVSLSQILGLSEKISLDILIEKILEEIEHYYIKLEQGKLLEYDYVQALFRLNENHYFKKNDFHFCGKIIGIDQTGRLKIETESSVEVFGFKEVEFMV